MGMKTCKWRKVAVVVCSVFVLIIYSLFVRPYRETYMGRSTGSTIKEGTQTRLHWIIEGDNKWPFNLSKVVQCPDVNFINSPLQRTKVSLHCNKDKAEKVTTITTDPTDIQVLSYDDTCLATYLRHRCHDNKPVPNVLHYIWYADREVSLFTFVSFMSVVRFMNPCLVIFHGPYIPRGPLWNFFIRVFPNVVSVNASEKMSVYGKKLLYREHAADVRRIEILAKYGGLYIDWDEVLLKPVDFLRNHPFTMGLEIPGHLGNQFIMAEPGAFFLKEWHQGYKNYSAEWSYNSIVYPYQLAKKFPEDVHVEQYVLLKPRQMGGFNLWRTNSDWAANYALHFYLRGYRGHEKVNVGNIGMLNTTIGAVCRYVLYGRKEMCTVS